MDLLTVQETAALLKVSDGTVRRQVAAGRLSAVRVGRLIRIRREAVERFFGSVPDVPPQPEDLAAREWPVFTEDDALWDLVGFVSTDEPTDIAQYKDEYIADAIEASSRGGAHGPVDCPRDR